MKLREIADILMISKDSPTTILIEDSFIRQVCTRRELRLLNFDNNVTTIESVFPRDLGEMQRFFMRYLTINETWISRYIEFDSSFES